MQPLVQKWTAPTDKSGKFHMAQMGNISISYIINYESTALIV